MGVIQDWQEPWEPNDFLLDSIASIERQFANGTDTEERYHINMAITNAIRKECDKVRYHCGQLKPDADTHNKAEALLAMGRVHVIENKMDEALALYEQSWEMDNEMEMATTEGGQIYLELQRYKEALVMFQRSLVLDPECDFICNFAGQAAAGVEDYPLALEYFTKAIEYDEDEDDKAQNEYFIGLCYDRMGDFYRALHHYSLCLDADPLFGEALGNMASLYYNHEGDVQTALTYLKKTEPVALETKNGPLLQLVYMNLSQLYNKIKDFEKHEYYKQKLLESVGLGFMLESSDGEDEDGYEDAE